MSISDSDKRQLKKLAHTLKPIVMIGQNGLSQGVKDETEVSLLAHELIKVKVSAADREQRDQLIEELRKESGAELIQRIGNIAVFYRHNPEHKKPLLT